MSAHAYSSLLTGYQLANPLKVYNRIAFKMKRDYGRFTLNSLSLNTLNFVNWMIVENPTFEKEPIWESHTRAMDISVNAGASEEDDNPIHFPSRNLLFTCNSFIDVVQILVAIAL